MKYLKYFFIFMFLLNSCAYVKLEKIERINYSSEYKIAINFYNKGEYSKALSKIEFVMKKISQNKDEMIKEYAKCEKMFGKNEKFCQEEKITLQDIEEWEEKFIELKKNIQEKILEK
jgi:hypothetical protein